MLRETKREVEREMERGVEREMERKVEGAVERRVEGERLSLKALAPPHGLRDLMPGEVAIREQIIATLRNVCELYGFTPLATPSLERYELLASKYGGGEEIVKEMYSLEDSGGRRLGLRYDLTISLARFVAANKQFVRPWPFKRYQYGQVFRDGPVSAARAREFLQFDADTVGVDGVEADAEIVALMSNGLRRLGVGKFVVRVNDRRLLDGICAALGISEDKRLGVLLSLDKLQKVGKQKVKEELIVERGLSEDQSEEFLKLVAANNFERFEAYKECTAALAELRKLFEMLSFYGVKEACFDPSLARGLAYYTGPIFEANLVDSQIRESVAAGGRYDELIGSLVGERIPATGASWGVERLVLALALQRASKEPLKAQRRVARAFIAAVGEGEALKEAIFCASELRRQGIACEVELVKRGLGKSLDYADRLRFPFCVLVGPVEIAEGRYRLRDMVSGQESLLTIEELVKALRSH